MRTVGGSELDEYANGQSSGQDHERDTEMPASPAKSDRDFTDSPPDIQVCPAILAYSLGKLVFNICCSKHSFAMTCSCEQPSSFCQILACLQHVGDMKILVDS